MRTTVIGLVVLIVLFLQLAAYHFWRDFVLKPEELFAHRRSPEADGASSVAADHIPHIIHWGWKDKMIGVKYVNAIDSFRKYHPNWNVYYWDDSTSEQFVREKYPQYLKLYLSYPKNIQRADIVRYMILHYYGGVYADLDFRWYKSMDKMLVKKHVVLCPEIPLHSELLINRVEQIVMNAWMASEPNHPFWLHVMAQARINKKKYDAISDRRVVVSTGPMMVQNAYDSFLPKDMKGGLTVLPYDAFYSQMDYQQASAYASVQQGCKQDLCLTETCRQLCRLLLASPDRRLPMSETVFGEHLWYHTWTKVLSVIPYYWISDALKMFGVQNSVDIRKTIPVELYPDIKEV